LVSEGVSKILITSISGCIPVIPVSTLINVAGESGLTMLITDFAIGPYYNSQLLQTQAFA
jgi:hypothetical protein